MVLLLNQRASVEVGKHASNRICLLKYTAQSHINQLFHLQYAKKLHSPFAISLTHCTTDGHTFGPDGGEQLALILGTRTIRNANFLTRWV